MPSKRNKNDDEASVTSERFQPQKTVESLLGEGEKFCRDQLFQKAIDCYTEALELQEGNKIALVERAACYLKLGKNSLALADAEESLKEDKKFTKGLYEKAEALYAMGEFELALVFYHRGKKLRGDVKEFQLGINKAQEAIDNCVGDPHSVKLEVKGDLSYFNKVDEKLKKKNFKIASLKYGKQPSVQKREKRTSKPGTQKTVKQLLGELYADKVYLEKLLNDDNVTRVNTVAGDAIWSLANNGLDFLDSRTEFWRQQKPIYARKTASLDSESSDNPNPLNYVIKGLEDIDNLQSNGKYKESIKRANKLLQSANLFVAYVNKKQLHGKEEIIANIHCCIGNAHLEMGQYDEALQSHQKDLDMSQDLDSKEGISRAYENIGRVYARNGKYKEAIEVWEKKLPLAETDMEKAWLYHEIGRCELELGEYETSKDYGKKSLACAEAIKDEVWELNATVLIAQSDVKISTLTSLNEAVKNFEKALKMTEKQNDKTAGNAITKALADCNQKLEKLSHLEDGQSNRGSAKSTKSGIEDNAPKEDKNKDPTPEPAKEPTPLPPKEPTPLPPKEPTPLPKSPTPEPPKEATPEPTPVTQTEKKSDRGNRYRVAFDMNCELNDDDPDANIKISLIGKSGKIEDYFVKERAEESNTDVLWIESDEDIGVPLSVQIEGASFLRDAVKGEALIELNYDDVTYSFYDGKWADVSGVDRCRLDIDCMTNKDDNSDAYWDAR